METPIDHSSTLIALMVHARRRIVASFYAQTRRHVAWPRPLGGFLRSESRWLLPVSHDGSIQEQQEKTKFEIDSIPGVLD